MKTAAAVSHDGPKKEFRVVDKFDYFFAFGTIASHIGQNTYLSASRFMHMSLLRYNWVGKTLSVPQDTYAASFNVSTRTIKRDVRRLIDEEFIFQKRRGGKGRVALYEINTRFLDQRWLTSHMGLHPDFDARVLDRTSRSTSKVVSIQNFDAVQQSRDVLSCPLHSIVQSYDEQFYSTWFHKIEVSRNLSVVELLCPTKFIAHYLAQNHEELIHNLAVAAFGSACSIQFSSS